jgi:hypothetical protein
MNLDGWKLVFVVVGLIGVLLIASPPLAPVIRPPSEEPFSGLYLLSSDNTLSNYPSNVTANVTYLIHLGVDNNMGSSCYYTCYLKVGNATRQLPNATLGTPSYLPALYEYKMFISDGQKWEAPLEFRVNDLTFIGGISHISNITVNGITSSVDQSSAWDSEKAGYYYYLFVELWVFNSTLGNSQYHNRFVSLVLNMTP